jgi:hypothetical protein
LLISLSKQFIFIANPKTASTAIENSLRKFAEIRLTRTPWGKHLSLAEVEKNFLWLQLRLPASRPFVFGVIRDPVDYVLSVYNSHRKPAFADKPHYTGNVPFSSFWPEFSRHRSNWLLRPQISRFMRADGQLGADCIIDYAHLQTAWPALCKRLDVPEEPLKLANTSPKEAHREDLSAAITAEIYELFAEDVKALQTCWRGSDESPQPISNGPGARPFDTKSESTSLAVGKDGTDNIALTSPRPG